MLIQVIFSFLGSLAFGIIANVPRRSLLAGGLTGMIGWLVYIAFQKLSLGVAFSTLVASIIIGLISKIFAKRFKLPITVFNIPGIIPLVPGGLAYEAINHFSLGSYAIGIEKTINTIAIGLAIAIGLIISEAFDFKKGR
ncbi:MULTISPECIES: threonine/serine exporter family protein [unclassified Enterococcus]|uniref:threonine/serine exporter family protein n=1 Tax=unclassified Enterococcus TaxID=2608891 RepID=UPI001554A399|nr:MULTISPECIES: threonine/serine exporter family protein [unclassified Enterococcus]MBS7577868.1 threonine/serine exporter family protein [Enterococcus sp. MMGLQ5-2]MBS7585128.1 threonine/serine exporter family protein [Enterococcus sp. MMGLQ5-1]NPD12984.1 threonine/serine exporter family protein [Enterococcus sp. MMGLQ5-1]NPD37698.1 threonine/serine exporter family protein [Enterococcus sp. MMGLQ5-2]